MHSTIDVPALEFAVPAHLEASRPIEYRGLPRDAVRLLVSDSSSGRIEHARFTDIAGYLQPGDVLVANDSATLPAALDVRRTNDETLALHLSSPVADTLWIVEPRSAVVAGEPLYLAGGGTARMLAPTQTGFDRMWYARVEVPEPLVEYQYENGRPIQYRYIDRPVPIEYYQTIFARTQGSAEMPSAARPFTARVLESITRRGVDVVTLTLHCGVASAEAGEPVQTERFSVPAATAKAINSARHEGRRVIAIGTTAVRALESAVRGGEVVAATGWTDLIVTPERGVSAVDGILTGFHEPKASHLSMLQAFVSTRDLARAYEAALAGDYLWHEFGDVHLIVPAFG